jgi:flagellar basal-body rod modification protein FlgD
MSTTEPTTTSPLSIPPTTSVVNNSPAAQLGKDDFMMLLVKQLQYQDPSNPTDSSQFMSQLAQFSSLEQMTNVNKTLDGISNAAQVSQGVELLGKYLTFTRSDGSTGNGIASSISVADGGSVVLDVGGEKVQPGQITAVGTAPAGAAPSGTTSTSTP